MRPKSTRSFLIFLILTIPLFTQPAFQPTNFGIGKQPGQSPAIVKVYFDGVNQLNWLAARYDIWEVDHNSGHLLAYLTPAEVGELNSNGFRLEIDRDLNSRLHQPSRLIPNQYFGIPGYPCYRTVEETYATFAQLLIDYPGLTSLIDIGDSWEKFNGGGTSGYDIHSLVISNKNSPGPKPRFYLIAAVHAREYATAELATRFAEHLLKNYGNDADITWLLDYFEIHITPYGNPDGRKIAENGIYWRKNTDNDDGCSNASLWGTDLNRNSSFKWGGSGASSNACSETYRGISAASEPETTAIQNYAASLFPDLRGPGDSDPAPENTEGVFITLHSYGELILYPWGWTSTPSPNDGAYQTFGRKFGYYTGYEVCRSGGIGCLYQTAGSNDDWVYGELGVASFTFELGSQFFESCSYFKNSILDKNIKALLYAFKAARRPYMNPAGPESIDTSLSAEKIAPGATLTLTTRADDTRYDSAGWGEEPVQPIKGARYSIDQPSWMDGTQTFSLSPLDGSLDSPVENLFDYVDTSLLTPGRHTIFIESQDLDGNWGVPGAAFFWVTEEYFQPALFPIEVHGRGTPGSLVPHAIQITNQGSMDDTYDLQVSGNTWEIAPIPDRTGPLAPQESQVIWIQVKIPTSTTIGDQDMLRLNVVSTGDPTKIALMQIETSARLPELYLPTFSK